MVRRIAGCRVQVAGDRLQVTPTCYLQAASCHLKH
jgi:hypothetical protein